MGSITPHILVNGITHKSSKNCNRNYVPIGDGEVIDKRSLFSLPNGKLLGDYIPFYFGMRTPMLYVIQKGLNGVTSVNPENIVYLACSIKSIVDSKIDFIFSNGHALDSFSDFFDESDLADLKKIVKKNDTDAKYWRDESDLDLKRRKEAEFLVGQNVPINCVVAYVVYNQAAKNQLVSYGIPEKIIYIKPNTYYF